MNAGYYLPQVDWKGKDAFVIGGGPSLDDFDWSLLTGLNTIGCNDAYMLGEEICGWIHFGDFKWWQAHQERLRSYHGIISTSVFEMLGNNDGVHVVKKHKHGLHTDGVGWNGNTGAGALNLALIAGARRVWLFGFDMQLGPGGNANWHPNEVDHPTEAHYKRFLAYQPIVVTDWKLKFSDVEIYNTNPESKLEGFPKVNWRDVPWRE